MRHFLLFVLGLMIATQVVAVDDEMIGVSDLREEASQIQRAGQVLVLEFASEYCEYCRKLEDQFLVPMQRNADYRKKVLIRFVSLDAGETLVDFDGQLKSTTDFAARYGVSLTPTLLFLDASGEELAQRLVGIWSEDYYGAYIDERIDEARDQL